MSLCVIVLTNNTVEIVCLNNVMKPTSFLPIFRLQNKQEEQVYLFYRVYTNGSSQTSGYDREERGTNTQATTDAEVSGYFLMTKLLQFCPIST